ncbi:MAG: hypothetical protein ACOX65_13055, partial [Anaerotruncus rubiinfantis]
PLQQKERLGRDVLLHFAKNSLPPPIFYSEVRGPRESAAFVGWGSEFEPRNPLQQKRTLLTKRPFLLS